MDSALYEEIQFFASLFSFAEHEDQFGNARVDDAVWRELRLDVNLAESSPLAGRELMNAGCMAINDEQEAPCSRRVFDGAFEEMVFIVADRVGWRLDECDIGVPR